MARRRVKTFVRPNGEVCVCAYLRVSTSRQAEADLSIPDQSRHLKDYCKSKGWRLVREFVEPGASAMDDQRPEFQNMVEMATGEDRPFDVILVHSFSRFFRNTFLGIVPSKARQSRGAPSLRHAGFGRRPPARSPPPILQHG